MGGEASVRARDRSHARFAHLSGPARKRTDRNVLELGRRPEPILMPRVARVEPLNSLFRTISLVVCMLMTASPVSAIASWRDGGERTGWVASERSAGWVQSGLKFEAVESCFCCAPDEPPDPCSEPGFAVAECVSVQLSTMHARVSSHLILGVPCGRSPHAPLGRGPPA